MKKMATENNFHEIKFSESNRKQTNEESIDYVVTEIEKDSGQEYEDVLNLIGFGKVQWIVLFTSGLLLMMVINETMGMSIITIVSQCDFATNSVDKAVMSAASFVGIFCSSYFWGCLSDTVGRKPVLIYTTFAGNIISLISVFIPTYWIFVLLRFVVGFCIAGASSTTYAYLGEFFIPRHRPVVINYASMFVGISTVYVPGLAWLVLSMDWSLEIYEGFAFRPWRLLIFFNLLPGLVGTVVLMMLPESPKILLTLNKDVEAYDAVNWIAKCNTKKSLQDLKVDKLKSEPKLQNSNLLISSKSPIANLSKMLKETRPLFRHPHIYNFVISCTVMCGLFFSSSGLGLWYPEIQNRLGSSTAENSMTVCDVIDASIDQDVENSTSKICNDHITTKSYIDTITYGVSLIVGYILLGIVINPLGRKVTIIGGLVIASACGLLLLWILEPIAIVVCFCLYLLLPGLCISVLSGAVVDLVPTHLRGKAVCICLMLGRSGSVFGSNIVGILLESYCQVTFGVFSGFVLVCAGLTLFLPI